jgi:hypothetical protein
MSSRIVPAPSSAEPEAAFSTEELQPDPAYVQQLGGVRGMEMVDLAIRAERLPHAPYAGILGSAGFTLLGAGLGALIAGADFTSGGVLGTLCGGTALLVGAFLVRVQRTENLGHFCADFMRYIDRWPPIHGGEANSAYVRRVASQREPSWVSERVASAQRRGSPR